MSYRINLTATAGLAIALAFSACHEAKEPTASKNVLRASDQEKRARGDALIKEMSDKLQSAQTISFSTGEANDRVKANNEKITINVSRQIAIRRPDRMWFKATGDRELECIYNGKVVTLISHKEKVFGEFPAAPTIDETADMITSRYDIPLPIADLLTFDPREALMDDKTSGGWVMTETVEGVDCNELSYQHPNVDFSIWIPEKGDPLPKKLQITYKARRGQPSSTIVFKDWNLAPQLREDLFSRKVPADYEGVPVIQRASAVLSGADQLQAGTQSTPKTQAPAPVKPKTR